MNQLLKFMKCTGRKVVFPLNKMKIEVYVCPSYDKMKYIVIFEVVTCSIKCGSVVID